MILSFFVGKPDCAPIVNADLRGEQGIIENYEGHDMFIVSGSGSGTGISVTDGYGSGTIVNIGNGQGSGENVVVGDGHVQGIDIAGDNGELSGTVSFFNLFSIHVDFLLYMFLPSLGSA